MIFPTRIVTTVALAGALGACAHQMNQAKVETLNEDMVARLPEAQRSDIVARQRNVNIAESNLATARAGVDDAKQFRSLAGDEVKSANSKLDAAMKGMEIADRNPQDSRIRMSSNETLVNARTQLAAAQAKREFASCLVDERQARVKEADAELRLARADHEWAKVKAVQASNPNASIKTEKFIKSHQDAEMALANARQERGRIDGDLAMKREEWVQRRHQRAAADTGPAAPSSPAEIPQPHSEIQVPEAAPQR